MNEEFYQKYLLYEDDYTFPSLDLVLSDGFIALGGDLCVARLVEAYKHGIFPWYNEGDPILWWCPNPRFVLYPDNVHVSESMRKILRRNIFEVRIDDDFTKIMTMCGKTRGKRTWIIPEMIQAYTELHKAGYAHCISVFQDGKLAGGLYGVHVGKVFCGESMFSLVSNSSKVAFIVMARLMKELGVVAVDCQFETSHLTSLGGQNISREEYLNILSTNEEIKPNFAWKELLKGRTTKDFV